MRRYFILAGFIIALLFVQVAHATKPEVYKTICHHNPAQTVTLDFVNEQSYTGHLGTPHSSETFDTDGPCEEPTTEPTTEPTISPTIEVTPTVVLSPTATPSASPSPTQGPTQGSNGYTDDHLGCGEHSCESTPPAPLSIPNNPPATGRG